MRVSKISALIMILGLAESVLAENLVGYPDGYRYWAHVKTMILHAGHPLENPFKGIHHIYANAKGVAGIKDGEYQDGATIVFDLFENNTADQASVEGRRILVGVMVKDRQRYTQTGGWGFEAWAGDSRVKRLTSDGGQSCFACHTSQQKQEYVFSRWRD